MFQKEEKPPEFIELKEDKRMKKRLLTIVLAIALLSSMLALPAAATEIEPRYLVRACEYCQELCRVRTRLIKEHPVTEAACKLGGAMVHQHVHKTYEEYIICSTCGESVLYTYINVLHGNEVVAKLEP